MGAKKTPGPGSGRQQLCYPLPRRQPEPWRSLLRSFMPKQNTMRLTFSLLLGMMNGKHEGGNGVALITPERSSVDAMSAAPGPTVPEPPFGSASTSYAGAYRKKDSGITSSQSA